MPSVADCLRQHAPAYYKQFGRRIPLGHRKTIDAITRCGTGKLGHVVYECDRCGTHHRVPRSCGNRHCPECQHHKTAEWVAKQIERLLPVHYFLVTFTVPREVRSVLRAHQRDGYDAIFDCGSQSMIHVASATRALRGCRLGFFGVLHTWGRDPMVYHPHVHFVVPGGGVNESESRWQATPNDFFVHHGTLIRVYREKFKDEMKRLGLYDQIPRSAWRKKWVVDIEPVGDGRGTVKYLAPYVNRVAISNNRIIACDETSVTFRYKPSKKKYDKERQVDGTEFVRGFAQHVLPSGLKKIRYYGWMTPNSRLSHEEIRWMVMLFLGWTIWLGSRLPECQERLRPKCECGGTLYAIAVTGPGGRTLAEFSVDYLDSG